MDWLWVVFEICNAFFEMLMMKMLAEGFLKNKRKISRYTVCLIFAAAIAVSFLVSTYMNGNFIVVALKTIFVALLISLSFCRSKIYWHGIVALSYFIFLCVAELIAVYLVSSLQSVAFGEVVEMGAFRYQAMIMVDIIFFIMIKLLCRVRKGKAQDIPFRQWAVLCLLPLLSLFIMLQMIFTSDAERTPVDAFSIFGALSVLFVNVLIFYVIETVVRQTVSKERLFAMQTQLAIQKEYYEDLSKNRSEIGRLSHDFKHHLQMFQLLSETEQYEELYARIKELSEQKSGILPMLDTGNPALDALLTAKQEAALCKGIQWQWDIQIPPELPLSMTETCAILGNALDNAIEACLRAETDAYISLTVHTSDSAILMEIKNTLGLSPIVSGGRMQSRKEDAHLHGLGLISMEESCKRLGGDMSYDYDDTVFVVRILIPL